MYRDTSTFGNRSLSHPRRNQQCGRRSIPQPGLQLAESRFPQRVRCAFRSELHRGGPLEESRTYEASVRAAWEGEVYGEAFFSELARLDPGTAFGPKWKLLAELEHVTGRQLAPLVSRYGFDTEPPGEELERGLANAREFAQMPHADFLALSEPHLEEVVSRYEALRDTAPRRRQGGHAVPGGSRSRIAALCAARAPRSRPGLDPGCQDAD